MRKMVHINYNSPINVKEYQPKTSQATKQWLPELNLSQFDHEVLLSPTSWLTDSIIDASQKLLQRMFPAISGFKSVCLGLTTSFQVQPGEFIQIINSRGHWVTVSTIGTIHSNIHVYDSLYSCANTYLKTQIACLLASEEPELQLSFMNVMMQSGPSECRVFAIAFATALAYGENPTQYLFVVKNEIAFNNVFGTGTNDHVRFQKAAKSEKSSHDHGKVRIYCSCRMPDLPDTKWIECTKCKEWYHAISCVVVPRTAFKSKVPWFCLKCK